MNVVNDRKDLLRFARRARARQGVVRAVDVALRAAFYALCAALAALLAAKFFGVMVPVRESVIGLCAVIGAAGLLALFFPRKDLLETAAEVDARAGWKERLSSALALPSLNHPMEQALVDDVREKLQKQRPSSLFPLRAPRELKFSPIVAIAIAGVAYLVPQVDVFGFIAREKEKKKEKEEISMAIERLERRKKELEKNDRAMDRVKDAIKKIDPARLVVVSARDEGQAVSFVKDFGFDAVTYHDPRDHAPSRSPNHNWAKKTGSVVASLKARLAEAGVAAPVYLQEPSRFIRPGEHRSDTDDDPRRYLTALANGRTAGAAAWTFHTLAGGDLSGIEPFSDLLLPDEQAVLDALRRP